MKANILMAMVLLVFISVVTFAEEPGTLDNLREWIGEYPSMHSSKPGKNIFNVPIIGKTLINMLKTDDYNKMTKQYNVQIPIKLEQNYLIVKVCRPHACNLENALLAINLSDGVMYVGFWEQINLKLKGNDRWFSNDNNSLRPIFITQLLLKGK
jgi:hypothetical protein